MTYFDIHKYFLSLPLPQTCTHTSVKEMQLVVLASDAFHPVFQSEYFQFVCWIEKNTISIFKFHCLGEWSSFK